MNLATKFEIIGDGPASNLVDSPPERSCLHIQVGIMATTNGHAAVSIPEVAAVPRKSIDLANRLAVHSGLKPSESMAKFEEAATGMRITFKVRMALSRSPSAGSLDWTELLEALHQSHLYVKRCAARGLLVCGTRPGHAADFSWVANTRSDCSRLRRCGLGLVAKTPGACSSGPVVLGGVEHGERREGVVVEGCERVLPTRRDDGTGACA